MVHCTVWVIVYSPDDSVTVKCFRHILNGNECQCKRLVDKEVQCLCLVYA